MKEYWSNEQCCGTCKYWCQDYIDGEDTCDVGECTRNPPTLVRSTGDFDNTYVRSANSKFPVTSYVRICGCYVDDRQTVAR